MGLRLVENPVPGSRHFIRRPTTASAFFPALGPFLLEIKRRGTFRCCNPPMALGQLAPQHAAASFIEFVNRSARISLFAWSPCYRDPC